MSRSRLPLVWLSACFLLLSRLSFAAPAPPGPVTLVQPDGSSLDVRMFGDEYGLYVETLDGYTLAQDSRGNWHHAVLGRDGNLVPSTQPPHADPTRFDVGKHLRPDERFIKEAESRRADANRNRKIHPRLLEQTAVPTPGISYAPGNPDGKVSSTTTQTAAAPVGFRLAVIPVEFPDAPHTYSPEQLDALFFSNGTYRFSPLGRSVTGSVSEFWGEASYGRFLLGGQVLPWVMADNTRVSYQDASNGDILLAQEVVAKSGVDLSQFDAYAIVYAGGLTNLRLWPHAHGNQWFLVSEKFVYTGEDLTGIGVAAHEFGHILGLWDLYYGPGNIGYWGIMAGGNYLNDALTPSHPTAWEKMLLGWVVPTPIPAGESPGLALPPSASSPLVYKLVSEHSYFLLENRQRTGFDLALPGTGLLVWHIDETAGNPTIGTPYQLDLEEADGTPASDYSNEGGDPFPGLTGNTAFTCRSSPSSADLDNNCTVGVSGIVDNGGTIVFDASVNWRSGVGISINGVGNYPSFYTAIQSAFAGQTVRVPAGAYRESIVMRSGIDVTGAGVGRSILLPDGQPMVRSAPWTRFSGFTLKNESASRVDALNHPITGYSDEGLGANVVNNCAFSGLYYGVFLAYNSLGAVQVENNVFDNSAFPIVFGTPGPASVRNNVFFRTNYALTYYGNNSSELDIRNNDFFGNVQDAWGFAGIPANAGNIASDPLFPDANVGDYYPRVGSLLIDAGDPDPAKVDPNGTRNDIGVFGGPMSIASRYAAAGPIETGRYVTVRKSTYFESTSAFKAGDNVLFRYGFTDARTGEPIQQAASSLSITGPSSVSLVSPPANADGLIEASWQTTPTKRKLAGTPTGAYQAMVHGFHAVGYDMVASPGADVPFSISP